MKKTKDDFWKIMSLIFGFSMMCTGNPLGFVIGCVL